MKYAFLLCGLLILSQITMGQEKKLYETDIYFNRTAEFKENPLKSRQIVFLGNSLIQGGKWADYYPGKAPANRGIIGNNTEGMLTLLDDIIAVQPEKLFFIGGVNDISQDKSNKEIIKNIQTLINRVKTESAETQIYVHSVLPVNNSFGRYKRLLKKEKQIKKLNKELEKLCKKEKITFINLYPLFLAKDKQEVLNPDYTSDGLHLNDIGYALWAEYDRKYIE